MVTNFACFQFSLKNWLNQLSTDCNSSTAERWVPFVTPFGVSYRHTHRNDSVWQSSHYKSDILISKRVVMSQTIDSGCGWKIYLSDKNDKWRESFSMNEKILSAIVLLFLYLTCGVASLFLLLCYIEDDIENCYHLLYLKNLSFISRYTIYTWLLYIVW